MNLIQMGCQVIVIREAKRKTEEDGNVIQTVAKKQYMWKKQWEKSQIAPVSALIFEKS